MHTARAHPRLILLIFFIVLVALPTVQPAAVPSFHGRVPDTSSDPPSHLRRFWNGNADYSVRPEEQFRRNADPSAHTELDATSSDLTTLSKRTHSPAKLEPVTTCNPRVCTDPSSVTDVASLDHDSLAGYRGLGSITTLSKRTVMSQSSGSMDRRDNIAVL